MSAPQKPQPGPRASLDRMREELTAGDLTHARTHALAAIAEALNAEPEPINATRHDPKADRVMLSIAGRSREDIPVTVTTVLGLTSYRFELDLGALGRQTVMLDLFHHDEDDQ